MEYELFLSIESSIFQYIFFDVFQFATISYPTISFHSIIILDSGSHLGSVCIKINTKSIISLKRRKKEHTYIANIVTKMESKKETKQKIPSSKN